MRKTFKSIKTWAVSALCVALLAGCTKDDFINKISDTYSTLTNGSSKFFTKEDGDNDGKPDGKVWNILDTKGEVKYYINPTVYMIAWRSEAKVSDASSEYVRLIREEMDAYGYVNVDNEDEADIVVNAVNFRLQYTNVVWVPGTDINPYYDFWGGYYPWLYPFTITVYTNKVLIEAVDAESLRVYRDWYNNIWKPANQDKYPSSGNVPEDKRPLTVWKCDIAGELSNESNSVNDSYVFNLIPQAFRQSSYMDIN